MTLIRVTDQVIINADNLTDVHFGEEGVLTLYFAAPGVGDCASRSFSIRGTDARRAFDVLNSLTVQLHPIA